MKNGKTSEVGRKQADMAAFSKPYLVLYNSVQTAGWSCLLFQALKYIVKHKTLVGLWETCGTNLIIFQTLAALEIIHCILRLVPANPVVTAVQVASRLMQVWGIMMPVDKVQNSYNFTVTLIVWSITEIVRYSYYCATLMGKPSKFHTWCRYSLFYVCYPAGVFGELSSMFLALDVIKRKQLFSILLPNPLNISFSYYYACIFVMLSYIPLFPQLFFHMVRQRKKVLSEDTNEKGKKKE